jgi:imidazolonepropionase
MRLKLRIRNASQIVQVCRQGEQRKVGKDQMNDLAILEGTAGDYCSMVVDQDGRIKAVGRESQLQQLDWYSSASYEQDIDLGGQSAIVPGLVDGHTHPVWAGDRVHEFEWKLAGKT